MNILTQNIKTMSSREIAELTGKRHDHVLRDIRAYAGAVIQIERGLSVRSMDWNDKEGMQFLGDTPVEGVTFGMELNPQNKQSYPICQLDKNTTLIIVSGYNVLLRKRIIERWAELEQQAQTSAPVIPQTLSQALRLAADQADLIDQQNERLALAEPKAAALDVIDSAMGSLNARDTAKSLGIQPQKFNAWCIAHKWMYRDGKDKLQMDSRRMKQGFMEQRPVTYRVKVNHNGATFYETRATTQPLFTPKGLTHLAKTFAIVHEVA